MTNASDYALLDSGNGRKLERFGAYVLTRPCAQAIWRPRLPPAEWEAAHAAFDRESGNRWHSRERLPDEWNVEVDALRFRLSGTDFGHLGIFPEQRESWRWIGERVQAARGAAAQEPVRVLNLFAYSGGSTLAAARAGAEVCHLDASAGMVEWARANAALNALEQAPIRWIVDDAHKFLARELRRGRRYEGLILDPPSFGRGAKGEVYKIERDLPQTLDLCRQLFSAAPRFLLLSAHTPGITPVVLENLLAERFEDVPGRLASGEMVLAGAAGVRPLPSGCMARWEAAATGRWSDNPNVQRPTLNA
jgi:23S rRNA (cytosine1962-C5)-methyltransferase